MEEYIEFLYYKGSLESNGFIQLAERYSNSIIIKVDTIPKEAVGWKIIGVYNGIAEEIAFGGWIRSARAESTRLVDN